MVRGKGRSEIYGVVISWFKDKKRGLVLDCPAGTGYLAMELAKLGYSVMCGEIDPKVFEIPDIPCIYIDMTKEIPFSDGYFDYVLCVEGLEHTTDPYKAVSEMSRVLKDGGYAIFTIPNYCNMEKRIKYVLTGYLTRPKSIKEYRERGNLYDFHNTPLTITVLDFILAVNDLQIVSIMKEKTKVRQLLFYPLVLVLWIFSFFLSEEVKNRRRTDLTLKPEVIMGGNTLIVVAKKMRKAS
ncbi:MAG: class I SAM-dependent methyltransferase [Desulfobacterota bacterium]|nr:class I SAM-dependent methyltransferase [Thermodesulfobacteriota bacterium]